VSRSRKLLASVLLLASLFPLYSTPIASADEVTIDADIMGLTADGLDQAEWFNYCNIAVQLCAQRWGADIPSVCKRDGYSDNYCSLMEVNCLRIWDGYCGVVY
jgi:hypothetical protein